MEFAIRILEGNSPGLYQAVGHLVLSPACLRANNNYPYKSSWKHSLHVLYQEERVVAFMPVERKTLLKNGTQRGEPFHLAKPLI